MNLQIYHTVNEGLYLWNGETGLLIDALHRGRGSGFSDTSDVYIRRMEQKKSFFQKPNDLLFTHTHGDHYDETLTDCFLKLYPGRHLFAPGLDRNNIQPVVLEEGVARMQMESYEIYVFTTEHDGLRFADYPHCSYLIRWEDTWIWVSGDARLTPILAEKIARYTRGDKIEKVFVMVYQIAAKDGRDFLRKLSPKEIILYHLPYPEDDCYHFHKTAEQMCRKCEAEGIRVRTAETDRFIV